MIRNVPCLGTCTSDGSVRSTGLLGGYQLNSPRSRTWGNNLSANCSSGRCFQKTQKWSGNWEWRHGRKPTEVHYRIKITPAGNCCQYFRGVLWNSTEHVSELSQESVRNLKYLSSSPLCPWLKATPRYINSCTLLACPKVDNCRWQHDSISIYWNDECWGDMSGASKPSNTVGAGDISYWLESPNG